MARQSYKRIYNMAYRLTGNRTDAEDLTQETFYRAYRSFDQYDGVRPFENWVLRIVTRLFLDLINSRRRRITAVSIDGHSKSGESELDVYFDRPDRTPTPEQKVMENTFSEDLQLALDKLSPKQRILVSLADIECMPYKDIAEIFETPIGTVRSRLHRAHKELRTTITKIRRDRQTSLIRNGRMFEPASS